MIGVHSLLRADNRGTRMLQHKHGQIVGIGVGTFRCSPSTSTVAAKRRESITLTSESGMGCVPKPGAIESKPRPGIGSAAHAAWCATHVGRAGTDPARRKSTSNEPDSWRRQARHIFRLEHQTDARFVAQLQTVGREVLAFRLGRILRLLDSMAMPIAASLARSRWNCLANAALAADLPALHTSRRKLDALRNLAGCEPLRERG